MIMNRKIVTCALLMMLPLTAHGEDMGLYVGGSVGTASLAINGNYFDDDIGDINLDSSTNSWKGYAGIQFLPFISIEGGYTRFGDIRDTTPATEARLKADTLALFARGTLPLGPLQVFAKGGYHFYDAEAAVRTLQSDERLGFSDSGAELAFGAGAGIELGAFTLRAEYEIFLVDNFDDLTMASIGVSYSF
ncbi:MAG: porin family protein [Halieaceae bacterium]|jgi:hypothetical protein|nr:porin family protein [Halieaceae bacterium]